MAGTTLRARRRLLRRALPCVLLAAVGRRGTGAAARGRCGRPRRPSRDLSLSGAALAAARPLGARSARVCTPPRRAATRPRRPSRPPPPPRPPTAAAPARRSAVAARGAGPQQLRAGPDVHARRLRASAAPAAGAALPLARPGRQLHPGGHRGRALVAVHDRHAHRLAAAARRLDRGGRPGDRAHRRGRRGPGQRDDRPGRPPARSHSPRPSAGSPTPARALPYRVVNGDDWWVVGPRPARCTTRSRTCAPRPVRLRRPPPASTSWTPVPPTTTRWSSTTTAGRSTPGAGSAFFLHVTNGAADRRLRGGRPAATLVRRSCAWLAPSARPLIAIGVGWDTGRVAPVAAAGRVSVGRTPVRTIGTDRQEAAMRVLGIDPGLTRCGWGVVDGAPGRPPTAVDVGVVRSSPDLDLELRLLELHTAVTALLREHRPDVVAIERVFTQNNKGTATGTAQAAGVAALAAAQADRPVAWHTPERGEGRRHRQRPRGQGPGDADGHPACSAWPRRPSRPTPPTRSRWRSARSGAAGQRCAAALAASARRAGAHDAEADGSRGVIASVHGRVAAVSPDGAVVEVGGSRPAAPVHPGHAGPAAGRPAARLSTSLVVREDSLTLYGFADDDERSLFELLQTANGVGPRLAQAVLAIHRRPRSAGRCRWGPQGAHARCPASARRAPSGWCSSCATRSARPRHPSTAPAPAGARRSRRWRRGGTSCRPRWSGWAGPAGRPTTRCRAGRSPPSSWRPPAARRRRPAAAGPAAAGPAT